jgi:hypothetical protein
MFGDQESIQKMRNLLKGVLDAKNNATIQKLQQYIHGYGNQLRGNVFTLI